MNFQRRPNRGAQTQNPARRRPRLHHARSIRHHALRWRSAARQTRVGTVQTRHRRTLYILDEPTTGLHFADIELLLSVINQLSAHGNTIVIIEHNLDD